MLIKYQILAGGSVIPSLYAGPAATFSLVGNNEIEMWTRFKWGPPDTTIFYENRGRPKISNLRGLGLEFIFGGELKLLTGPANLVLDARYALGITTAFVDVKEEYFSAPRPPARIPAEHQMAGPGGEASDAKNRVLSITLGVSVPM